MIDELPLRHRHAWLELDEFDRRFPHLSSGCARALDCRAILSRGKADLPLVDDEPDCLTIGDVNQQVLIRRVAAVVQRGGAGTATATARAGTPQVVIP